MKRGSEIFHNKELIGYHLVREDESQGGTIYTDNGIPAHYMGGPDDLNAREFRMIVAQLATGVESSVQVQALHDPQVSEHLRTWKQTNPGYRQIAIYPDGTISVG